MKLTEGDFELFNSFIIERDVVYVAKCGFDHIRLGFDQIVLEESPGKYRERTFRCVDNFVDWCRKHRLGVVLNLHKTRRFGMPTPRAVPARTAAYRKFLSDAAVSVLGVCEHSAAFSSDGSVKAADAAFADFTSCATGPTQGAHANAVYWKGDVKLVSSSFAGQVSGPRIGAHA